MNEHGEAPVETLTYDNMNDWLVALVPSLRQEYEEWVEIYQGEPVGPHVAYGLLAHHLVHRLNEGSSDGDLVAIFGFIEELAQHEDERVVNVVAVTVVEHLLGWLTGEALARAIANMGLTTRDIAGEMASMFKTENEIRRLLEG